MDNAKGSVRVNWGEEELLLMPQKAVWWKSKSALFVSDIHIGKAKSFQKVGIPLPDTSATDFETLFQLIELFHVQHLYLLGDLLHSEMGLDDFFTNQLLRISEYSFLNDFHWILGNHDSNSNNLNSISKLKVHTAPVEIFPFELAHEPRTEKKPSSLIRLCGHVHPGVSIPLSHGKHLRVPCFVSDPSELILPAFGLLTGTYNVKPGPGRDIYPIIDRKIIRINEDYSFDTEFPM